MRIPRKGWETLGGLSCQGLHFISSSCLHVPCTLYVPALPVWPRHMPPCSPTLHGSPFLLKSGDAGQPPSHTHVLYVHVVTAWDGTSCWSILQSVAMAHCRSCKVRLYTLGRLLLDTLPRSPHWTSCYMGFGASADLSATSNHPRTQFAVCMLCQVSCLGVDAPGCGTSLTQHVPSTCGMPALTSTEQAGQRQGSSDCVSLGPGSRFAGHVATAQVHGVAR